MVARVLAAQGKADKARTELQAVLAAHAADGGALALARDLGVGIPPANVANGAPPNVAVPPSGAADADPEPAVGIAAPPRDARLPARSKRGPPPNLDPSWASELAGRYADAPAAAPRRRAAARKAMLRTLALAVAVAAALGGGAVYAASRRAKAAEVRKLLAEARPLLEKDTWAAARDAAGRCARAASLGADPQALACAAWAEAVRFADHGEAASADAARKHLAALGSTSEPRAAAAATLLALAGGGALRAADELRPRAVKEGGPILHEALGEALLAAGNLDGAKDALSAAQQLAPGDVRTLRLLAEQFRRRGGESAAQADVLYAVALERLAPGNPGILLGRARLSLDRRAAPDVLAAADQVVAAGDAASPRQRAVAQALRARALALAGRKDDAAKAEQAATALDAASAEVREILGRTVAAR
jgi:hypothetical protein